ncbi:hypothetical protein M3Y99_00213600 [Aphelenchoides fujianensis]|nr:hypothetical protein M3Y99_00213600 [Aphelenchoides fujianensis]
MRRIIKLLDVPIHVDLGTTYQSYKDACKELKESSNLVNGLTLRDFSESPAFAEFVEGVAPNLKQLECLSSVLARFPPLDLERVDYARLSRHKIRQLDVPIWEIGREFADGQVLSPSITSLGINDHNALNFRHELIEAFCRRFPALEELHISVDSTGAISVPDEHYKKLWTACLELRDQLNVPGLKRFFFAIQYDCTFLTRKNTDWITKLKQVEPFDETTFTVGRFSKNVRMFLKHNRPRDAKAVFFQIEGYFRCMDVWSDVDSSDEEDEDEDLDGFDEDAMDDAGAD